MRTVTAADIDARLALDTPWCAGRPEPAEAMLPRRAFFESVRRRAERPGVTVLAGPRRVGKTVLARQIAADAATAGVPVAWASLESPLVSALPLDALVARFTAGQGAQAPLVVLDSVHRRPEWEAELAALPPGVRVLAVSALAPRTRPALVLPPLTFCEHLRLGGVERDLIEPMTFGRSGAGRTPVFVVRDIAALNGHFQRYLDVGGFPETVLLRPGGGDAAARLREELLPVLLHHDLPGLVGVGSSADLTRLFVLLARNNGREVSIEAIAEHAVLAKNTVRRYLDFLESAFLIHRMPRVHPEGGRFRRMRTFKVHLTAPGLHAALFGLPSPGGEERAALAESAVIGQWLAAPERPRLHFARLPEGMVDLVALDPESGRPAWACALPGTDESVGDPDAIGGLLRFAALNAPLRWIGATTGAVAALRAYDGVEVWHRPASQYCYEVGRRAADEA